MTTKSAAEKLAELAFQHAESAEEAIDSTEPIGNEAVVRSNLAVYWQLKANEQLQTDMLSVLTEEIRMLSSRIAER